LSEYLEAMDVVISDPAKIGRVAAVSGDGTRMWVHLAAGGTATVTSAGEPLEHKRGAVVLVHDSTIEPLPDEAWPEDSPQQDSTGGELWVGVVKLRHEQVTVVDTGGRFRGVPTNHVEYEPGNTVEGTDSGGVSRVLDLKPLRYVDVVEIDDDVIAGFRREPSGDVGFGDFGGLPEVVARAQELIELPLAHRDQLRAIGAEPIKGVLFTGRPGTGKTMLARIIANVAGATFYEISGPTIFSKWFGESEQILRRIFDDAAARAPSIVFFDEIDSVAGQRNEEAHEESKRVVAQLLTLMDGFTPEKNVTVIAATNRPQDIDVALLRPGRFDWKIDFPLPDRSDRQAILEVSAKRLKTDDPLPHAWAALNSDGWSAAELAAIWKEAALLAVADDRELIMTEDYLVAHARVAAQRSAVAVHLPEEQA
jgi:transitional endoplasmic reticulum ATPase